MMTECDNETATLHNIGNVCEAYSTDERASDLPCDNGTVAPIVHTVA